MSERRIDWTTSLVPQARLAFAVTWWGFTAYLLIFRLFFPA